MTFASLGEVFAELDAEAHQGFVQLVRPGAGTEDTRRLATSAEAGEENWGLVQHLTDKRLVVTGRDAWDSCWEIIHEKGQANPGPAHNLPDTSAGRTRRELVRLGRRDDDSGRE